MTYSNVLSGFRCISTKTPPENPRTRFARHTKRSTLYRRASKSTRIFKTLARIKLMTYFCSLSFVFRTGEAWPTEMRGCDMDAHPSTARARHGIPKKSTNTKIYVSWASGQITTLRTYLIQMKTTPTEKWILVYNLPRSSIAAAVAW